MLEKIKPHFLKLGPSRFVVGAVLVLFILDIINSIYLRLYWIEKKLSVLFVTKLANNQGLEFSELSQDTLMQIQAMINNAFFFFLFIVLINNLFFYFFYLRKKLWAQGYILFYTLTNSLLAMTFIIEGPIMGWEWLIYNVGTIFLYLYLYMGVKTLKVETTDFIPGHEKKGR